jgi:hypothetical protein
VNGLVTRALNRARRRAGEAGDVTACHENVIAGCESS